MCRVFDGLRRGRRACSRLCPCKHWQCWHELYAWCGVQRALHGTGQPLASTLQQRKMARVATHRCHRRAGPRDGAAAAAIRRAPVWLAGRAAARPDGSNGVLHRERARRSAFPRAGACSRHTYARPRTFHSHDAFEGDTRGSHLGTLPAPCRSAGRRERRRCSRLPHQRHRWRR